ncbi:Gfo/Idh/MocA family oxidoreductase [Microbacterium paludicola]|uniref:Gfo/Idh/MocA family protein n=1 Tax=Microbacterium paludicola TaxID=300019 RepID=UPI00286BC632|nr:Gfo/Idh/MocA family oxidoreductase [Microbacterium paludicola]
MPRTTTIALVGVHGYGTVHLDNLRRLGDRVRLVAAADPRPPALGALPEHTRVFADLPALLAATDDIDVVIVATPLHTHLELARTVVGRGIDLYLEKPPVLTLADLRVLQEAAATSGARVQVGFQSLGSRALRAFAEDRFDLGPIRAIGAVGLWATRPRVLGAQPVGRAPQARRRRRRRRGHDQPARPRHRHRPRDRRNDSCRRHHTGHRRPLPCQCHRGR